MKTIVLILIGSALSLSSLAQKTGVRGQLYLFVPDSGLKKEILIPYEGIPLEIFIHKATTLAEVDFKDGIISKIYTPLVSRFFCKWNGSFKVKLPPGNYSVFVRYQNGFYGNLKDSEGNLSPATVSSKRNAWITITVNYSTYH